MKILKSLLIIITGCFLASGCLLIDDSPLQDASGRDLGDPRFASGPEYGNYYPFADGIIDAAGETLGIFMENVSTAGSLENAAKIVGGDSYMGDAYMAMMQEDVFTFARKTNVDNYDNDRPIDKDLLKIASQVQVLLALFKEDVHLLVKTGTGITSLTGLAGKIVNLGAENSGTYVTASTIMNAHGIAYTAKTDDASAGIDKVISGEYDAAFFVSAAPSPVFQAISADANVQLISVQMPASDKTYDENGTIKASLYEFQDVDVGSNITVKTLLVAGPNFDDRNVGLMFDYIIAHAGEYKSFNYKWDDVSVVLSQDYMKANPEKCNYRAMCYVSGFPELDPFYIEPIFSSAEGDSSYHDMAVELIWLMSHNMDVDLRERNTTGSWENAYYMMNGDSTMAIVQDDIFPYLVNNNDMYDSMMAASMRKIVPLHYEYVHLLVNTVAGNWNQWAASGKWGAQTIPSCLEDILIDPADDVNTTPQLYINAGPKTSGTFISAMTLIRSYSTMDTGSPASSEVTDYPDIQAMEINYGFDSPYDAVAKVSSGPPAGFHAMFVVSGLPYDRFYAHETYTIPPNIDLIDTRFYDKDSDGDYYEDTPFPYSEVDMFFEGNVTYEDYPYSDVLFQAADGDTVFEDTDSIPVVSIRAVQVASPVYNHDDISTYLKSVFRKSYYMTEPSDPDVWPESFPLNHPLNNNGTDDDGDGVPNDWVGFQPDQLWLPINKESISKDYSSAVYHDMVGAREYFVRNPFGWHSEAVKYYLSMFEEN